MDIEISHGTVDDLLRNDNSIVSMGCIMPDSKYYSSQGSCLLKNIHDLMTCITSPNIRDTCHQEGSVQLDFSIPYIQDTRSFLQSLLWGH